MENLICILDSIEYSPIFDEETALNFMETSLHLIDELNEDFHFKDGLLKDIFVNEPIFESIFEIWLNQLENSYECNHILLQDTYLEEMHDLLEATIQIYMDCFDSYNGSWMLEEHLDKEFVNTEFIETLNTDSIETPDQDPIKNKDPIKEEPIKTVHTEFIETTDKDSSDKEDKDSDKKELDKKELDKKEIFRIKIKELRERLQPAQRTDEWYTFRNNLITASDAHKVFKSQATLNELVFKKCKDYQHMCSKSKEDRFVDGLNDGLKDGCKDGLNDELNDGLKDGLNDGLNDVKKIVLNTNSTNASTNASVNVNSSLHWGQKYEPLSVMIYEDTFSTKVGEFGCMQHPKYSFLGASPDGINIDESSEKYGKMLEIKNVVSRVITGIPKNEYWIQMQLQMEVCDLDECDFLETKFTEYEDEDAFLKDSPQQDFSDVDVDTFVPSFSQTSENKLKGIIIYFNKPDGNPFYVYKPIQCIQHSDIDAWETEMLTMYQGNNPYQGERNNLYQGNNKYGYMFVKYIYWKLEVFSCVHVTRDKLWFKNNIQAIQDAWNIIEKERTGVYSHRAPKKKITNATSNMGLGLMLKQSKNNTIHDFFLNKVTG